MSDPVVQLKDVCFCRKDRTILDAIDWMVEPGQHWALLGANGSGKTTLLKILSGYEWPTFGQVIVQGQTFGMTDLRVLRKTIGHISSAIKHRLPEQDTSIEIVASGLDSSIGLFRQIDEREREISLQALASLRTERIAQQEYKTLSQGERQIVLIARGLVSKPRLLILDEPCLGLDPSARTRFLKDLEHMTKQKDTPSILYVTHHIEEIGPWITHIMMLKEGKVLKTGTPDETITSELMSKLLDCRCESYFVYPRWQLLIEE